MAFIKSMFEQALPEAFKLDIYLLDDNSSDGTADYVRANFPAVKVVDGTGSLYWAGGMRKVWNYAVSQDDYDFFLLLNDDVKLMPDALARLFEAYAKSDQPANILLGTVLYMDGKSISYGGWKRLNRYNSNVEIVVPDENTLIDCEVANANVMLVDKNTVARIGILYKGYTHGLADFDYTLRAVANGVKVSVAPGYYGYCDFDHGKNWLPASIPLKKRVQYLYSPTGLAYKEYLEYIWRHFPYAYPGKFLKLWLKTLFPQFYDTFKTRHY
ncbi:MAG: glycosyltransferase family 2 protein [Bacteroidetes bacterium]|nr:glycosyltransferase family 2 protein [Bacteroidota bacterium]